MKEERSLASLCALLLGMSLLPGLVCVVVYAASGRYVHEGVAAAYLLPLVGLFVPIVVVALKCFERAGAYNTKRFEWFVVALGVSAALLIAPYLALW